MVEFMVPAHNENPNIYFEVFVHKAEKLPEEDKIGHCRHSAVR
jgi:Ras-related GTP-binding protein C/D